VTHLLVFDSGIGGLGVAREIRRLQPEAGLTYLADNGFFPYGEKADAVLLDRIVGLIGQAIAALRPDAVVVACNTASTIALGSLRAAYRVPFIGCVPPIKPAASASVSRHIGVLATAATIRRPYLNALIEQFAPGCAVHSLGTPTLAALAEQKFRGHRVDVAPAIAPLFAEPGAAAIDAVALGCTHYTFLLDELRALHPRIAWFDPALPVARQTRAVTESLECATTAQDGAAYFTAALTEETGMRRGLAAFGFDDVRLKFER
jgi:glutamate racemase